MKIAILGAGAMGSPYASYLAAGHDVILVDSYQAQVDWINADGLIKVEKNQSETRFALKAVMSGSDIGVQDLVIAFVKSIHTYDAVKENQALIGSGTMVMTLQNGAGNNRDIAEFVAKEHIIVGTTSHNSVMMGPGKIYHSGCGPTNIGPDFPCEQSLQDVKKVADALKECKSGRCLERMRIGSQHHREYPGSIMAEIVRQLWDQCSLHPDAVQNRRS